MFSAGFVVLASQSGMPGQYCSSAEGPSAQMQEKQIRWFDLPRAKNFCSQLNDCHRGDERS